jgi:hypothetical protein
MKYPKKMYPHLYEYMKLNDERNPKSRQYGMKYKKVINEEHDKYLEIMDIRDSFGGNYSIHKRN